MPRSFICPEVPSFVKEHSYICALVQARTHPIPRTSRERPCHTIPDEHMNMPLWQLLQECFGMPKISRYLPKLIPIQEKHNPVHMMAYDALVNVPMVLQCFAMFLQSLTNFGKVCGLLNRESIGHQLPDSVTPASSCMCRL